MRPLIALAFLAIPTTAFAVDCPNPGESCKVITFSESELQALTGQNMILDSAAQARALELGAAVVYFRTKIANAPTGTVLPKEVPKPPEPADKK